MKSFGNIIKYTIYVIVAILLLFFLWRIFFAYDYRTLSDINVSEDLKKVYEADGDFLSNNIHNDHSTDGYFAAYSFVYIPDINQIQVTVRYNESILEELKIPEGEYPEILLSLNDDKTYTFTEIDKDEFIHPAEVTHDKRLFYNYMRLVFDNVPDSNDKNIVLTLRSPDNTDNIVSYHVLHYAEQPFENYKFSGKEKKSIKSFAISP